jgi:hypothetical protein
MSAWHAVTDSASFRRLVKQGPGRRILRSRAFSRLNVARNNALSASAVRRDPDEFRDVRTFCFFVGHNKSGTSMVGALLDAHPNVILADEVDALQYVQAGFGRDQIFHLLAKGSRTEARKGRVTARRLEPYSYWVPGQWQGRYTTPLVVGDSTSGTSTRRLGASPELLDRLPRVMSGVHVKVVQVIRNPFDPISVMMVRGHRSMENAIDHYFAACQTLVRLRRALGPEALLPVRHEAFVGEPEAELARVCRFVGVDPDPEYLRACASIIRRRPDRSRDMVTWTEPWIDVVEERIARFDFLRGYSYGN